jgi:ectoine hydroxylase-related dioxygenase (phytanoyl-CoA dioxygenase family)
VLGAADLAFFANHGWLVLRKVVAPPILDELNAALDALVPPSSYAGGFEGRVVEIAGISRGSPAIGAAATDPRLGEAAAALLDARRAQLLQDTALVKPPAGGPVAWHQDYSYLGYLDRPAVVTARLALTPCTAQNGCLRAIDGSHRWGLQGGDLSFRRESVADTLPAHLRGAESTIELDAGDVSIHHCLTFHASDVNRSDRTRKTLAFRLMDGACRLVADRLPSPSLVPHFPVDAAGHLTGATFPVVHEGPP